MLRFQILFGRLKFRKFSRRIVDIFEGVQMLVYVFRTFPNVFICFCIFFGCLSNVFAALLIFRSLLDVFAYLSDIFGLLFRCF